MVYLDADNNLEKYGLEDVNEMEEVSELSPTIEVIVLIDRARGSNTYWGYSDADGDWKGAKIFRIQPDTNTASITSPRLSCPELGITSTSTDGEEVNMGNGDTLTKFINCAKLQYPAKNYALIIWNHGGGWRDSNPGTHSNWRSVVWDEDNYDDYLTTPELYSALTSSLVSHWKLLGIDACLMGMIEVAYQFKDLADYLVLSEKTEPADGWEYNDFLSRFKNSDQSALALGTSIIDAYATRYSSDSVTLALIDASKLEDLKNAIDALAAKIANNDETNARNYAARANGQDCFDLNDDYTYASPREYMDIYDYADRIRIYYDWADDEANALKTAVSNAIVHKYINGVSLFGLSIMYPSSTGSKPANYLDTPGYLFLQDSQWDNVIMNKLYTHATCSGHY